MLKIRLQRVGKKNAPSFRVVLAEHKSPPQGKFQEILGFYNPRSKEKKFKEDRIKHWISKGAQPSPTVYNLLIDEGVLSGTKIKTWRPKKKKEEERESPKKEESKEKEEKIEEEKQKPEKEEKIEEKSEKKEVSTSKEIKAPTLPEASVEKKPKENKKEEKTPEQNSEDDKKQKEN